jgi:NTE family protein
MQRYTSVIGEQASAIRKRWLIAGFIEGDMQGTYWGIGSAASHYGCAGGYSESLVEEVVSEVRTDLDAFSEAEQAVIENHGYVMAEAAIQKHAPDLISIAAPLQVPYPLWQDEARVRVAMAESHKRRLLGRW